MSKVSLQNESSPSFEPIQYKLATQKRKRTSNTLKDATSNGDSNQPAAKKSKAKKSSAPSVPMVKSVVWIGATMVQAQERENDDSEIAAAYSIYYGINDTRNITEKVSIAKDQDLAQVYTLGAIRALENCGDDSSNLLICTGSDILPIVPVDERSKHTSAACDELKEKIANRKGSTSIHYKAQSTDNEEECKVAHNMAKEKLVEDLMIVDNQEAIVNSLEVTETEVSVTTTTVQTIITKEADKEVETVIATSIEEEVTTLTSVEPVITTPSWASTLSLRNLLDVLKAPFSRKN